MTKDKKISPLLWGLPWKCFDAGDYVFDIQERNGDWQTAGQQPEELNDYILKAVNNHEQLVEMVREFCQDLEVRDDGYSQNRLVPSSGFVTVESIYNKAQQLLKQIEEGDDRN